MEQNLERARKILSQKNSGPSGVLAFTMAHTHESRQLTSENGITFRYNHPVYDAKSNATPVAYFGVVISNRTGIEVATPPGGTQDILFKLDGVETSFELVKPQKQIEFLSEQLGVTQSEITDEAFVAALLSDSRITDLRLESAFLAAARETHEEHGWKYSADKHKILDEIDVELLSKRSFTTTPPTPISQKMFIVKVDNFDGTKPVRTDKKETKIKSLLGNSFFEQGDFMTVTQLELQLLTAEATLRDSTSLLDMADIDLKAAKSRVEMIKAINNRLILSQ